MKYTAAALGCLNARYRAVLKKCLLINLGFFALTHPMICHAADTIITEDVTLNADDLTADEGSKIINQGSTINLTGGTINTEISHRKVDGKDGEINIVSESNVSNAVGDPTGKSGPFIGGGILKVEQQAEFTNNGFMGGSSINNYGTIVNNGYWNSYQKLDYINHTGATLINEENAYLYSGPRNEGIIKNKGKWASMAYNDAGGEFENSGTITWQTYNYQGAKFTNTDTGNANGIYNYGSGENEGTISYVENGGMSTSDKLLNKEASFSNSGTIESNVQNYGGTFKNTGIIKEGINNSDKVIIEGGVVEQGIKSNTGTIQISGGTIKGYTYNSGTMDITGGELLGTLSTYSNKANVTTSADFLKGDIYNSYGGTINLTGGTLSQQLQGSGGILNITGDVKNASNINQQELNIIENATLTSDAEAIVVADNTITNDGTLDLTGGTNTNAITGEGTVTVSGDVTNNAAIDQNNVNIESGKSLANNNTITADVTNNGSLDNNNGTINGIVTNNSSIYGAVGTINGKLINNADAIINDMFQSSKLNGNLENAGTVDMSGIITGDVTNKDGGFIKYIKQVDGNVTNETGGTIKTIGTLNGDLLNETGAFLTDEQGSVYSNIKGTLTNNGTIEMKNSYNAINIGNSETKTGDFINNGIAKFIQGTIYGNLINGENTVIEATYGSNVYGGFDNKGTYTGGLNITGDDLTKNYINNEGTIKLDMYGNTSLKGTINNAEGAIIGVKNENYQGQNGGYSVNNAIINNSGTISGIGSGNNIQVKNETTGEIEFGAGSRSGTINNKGTIKIYDGIWTVSEDGIQNSNKFTIQNGGVYGSGKFVNKDGGQLNILSTWGPDFRVALENAGTVNNAGTITGPSVTNSGTINNTGIIASQTTNSGTINNTSQLVGTTTNSGTINNTGQIQSQTTNSGTIINKAGSTQTNTTRNESTGTIIMEADSHMSGTWYNKGKIENHSNQNQNMYFENQEGGNFQNFGTIAGGSALYNRAGATLTNETTGVIDAGYMENSGTLNNAGTIKRTVSNIGILENTGLIEPSAGNAVLNQSTGILTNKGTINTHVSNNGKLENIGKIAYNATESSKSAIVNYATGTLTNKGTIGYLSEEEGILSQFVNMGTATNEENGIISAEQIINNKDAELTSLADKLITADNTITNAGTLTLTSGTNANRLVNTTTSEGEVIKGTLNIAGNVTNNATIEQKALNVNKQAILTNAENINVESVTNSGTINNDSGTLTTNELVNQEGAELITSAENIITADNTIQNAGTVTLTGGTNANYITGTGSVAITGNVTNNAEVTQKAVNIAQTGALTTSADSLHLTDSLANDGALTLTSGTNANTISGTGSTTIAGNITNNAEVTQKAVNIAQIGALTTSADTLHLTDSLTNDGTLTLTSGTNTNTITGLGKIAILDNFDLGTGTISGNTVEVESGTLKMSQNNNFDNTATLKINQGVTFDLNDHTATLKEANFATGSVLKLNVNALNNHGTLNANTITVENGATLKATLAQGLVGYGKTAEINLLNAENKDFNNFNDEFDNNMYRFEKSGKNGAYAISLVKTAAEVAKETGASNTQAETAKAWVDGERFNNEKAQEVADKLADLAQNNQAEFVETLETIAPTQAPVVHDMTTDVNDRILQATVDHLKYGAAANMYGMSSGDEFNEVSVWGKTYLSQTDRETTSGIQGFKVKSHGVVGGFDKKLNQNTKLGLGLQYDNADISSPNRKTDVDSLTGFIYGQYRPDNRFINWLASYGKADYDESKIALNQKFDAKYDAKTYALQGIAGYDLHFNDNKITPEIGMRYYNIHRSTYKDGLGQRIKSQDMDILRAAAGVSFARDFCFGMCKITPEVYLGLTYDIIADNDKAVVMLDNGASYTVNGKRLNRLGYEAAVGLTASLNDSIEISLGYNGTYRKNYDNHMGLFNVKYKF
ncbi:MAG: autotransporter domain-containing protein [Alphaproteobacteria bacterium]|nr:autotransporter domain-containing protein [Alphaproteobacteria bacterium]